MEWTCPSFDDVWALIAPLLPPRPPHRQDGRPWRCDRRALCALLFIVKTGCVWNALPRALGCGSGCICWRRLRDWQADAPPPAARQGFVVRREIGADGLHLETQIGPVGRRFITGFRHSVRAFALTGNNVIVDDVLYEEDEQGLLAECGAVMAGLPVFFVKVSCPLAELERRERARGDRLPGVAAWQLARMRGGVVYDLAVDTSRHSPDECARRVMEAIANSPTPSAFERLRHAFSRTDEWR